MRPFSFFRWGLCVRLGVVGVVGVVEIWKTTAVGVGVVVVVLVVVEVHLVIGVIVIAGIGFMLLPEMFLGPASPKQV